MLVVSHRACGKSQFNTSSIFFPDQSPEVISLYWHSLKRRSHVKCAKVTTANGKENETANETRERRAAPSRGQHPPYPGRETANVKQCATRSKTLAHASKKYNPSIKSYKVLRLSTKFKYASPKLHATSKRLFSSPDDFTRVPCIDGKRACEFYSFYAFHSRPGGMLLLMCFGMF